MSFAEFYNKAWSDHGEDAKGVADRLREGLSLATEAKHLPALAGLVVHVHGEHLGQWEQGVEMLHEMRAHDLLAEASPESKAISRSLSILLYCRGDEQAAEAALQEGLSGGEVPEASDRARVSAIVASTFAGQGRFADAIASFRKAVKFIDYEPAKGDPVAQSMAITGNNLASALEEKPNRSADELSAMKLAAQTGRKYWEIAGDWKNVERAEYRLAMTHLSAAEADTAVEHATLCLRICEENGEDPCEMFFAKEALARAYLAAGDLAAARASRDHAAELVEKQDEGMRDYCAATLEKLDQCF